VNHQRWFILSSVLAVCLVVSVAAGYVYFSRSSVKSFVLEWSAAEQEIVNGTLRMEFTFEWQNESLSITVKINDDEYDMQDMLGFVFDRNGNGTIDLYHKDTPYVFTANNWTWYNVALRFDGCLVLPKDLPLPSPYHTCVFIEGTGYLFNISIPKSELANVKADVVHIFFGDVTNIPPWLDDWVSSQIEGWQ